MMAQRVQIECPCCGGTIQVDYTPAGPSFGDPARVEWNGLGCDCVDSPWVNWSDDYMVMVFERCEKAVP